MQPGNVHGGRDGRDLALFHELNSRKAVKPGELVLPGKPKRVGRNDKCPCGSGKKFKKCCLAKSQGRRPQRSAASRPRPIVLEGADTTPTNVEATKGIATAISLLNAGVAEDIVWAYVKTGLLIREHQKHMHTDSDVAKWQEAIDEYTANPEDASARLVNYLDTSTPSEKD